MLQQQHLQQQQQLQQQQRQEAALGSSPLGSAADLVGGYSGLAGGRQQAQQQSGTAGPGLGGGIPDRYRCPLTGVRAPFVVPGSPIPAGLAHVAAVCPVLAGAVHGA